jgi:RNA polymerase sigma factor for flagellar operon FliA
MSRPSLVRARFTTPPASRGHRNRGRHAISEETRLHLDVALGLVPVIVGQVKRQLPAHARVDDLTSFAQEGALLAARSFDPGRGVPFLRWASLKTRAAVLDGIRRDTILPRSLHVTLRSLASEHSQKGERTVRCPGSNARGADARLSAHLSAMAHAIAAGMLMQNDPSVLDGLADERATAEDQLAREELKAAVLRALSERPLRERRLLTRHYFKGATLEEASGGLSRSGASRLHARAVQSLAKALRGREGRTTASCR